MNVVLTGSSAGIGRALAERLIAGGHRVWGLARSPQEAPPGAGDRFRSARCDVSSWADVARAAAEVAADWPHVDGLVTCAGVHGDIAPLAKADPAAWSATVRVNLDGTFHALRAFHEQLLRAPRRAKVVCFSGGGATKARPNFSAYAAAKTGIVRLVETVAAESRGLPLDCNAVAPGSVDTRLTDEIIARGPEAAGREEHAAAVRQKAAGSGPMAKALGLVEWLLSPASDGVTGRLISAPWDPWPALGARAAELAEGDVYMLRRIVPEERGKDWKA